MRNGSGRLAGRVAVVTGAASDVSDERQVEEVFTAYHVAKGAVTMPTRQDAAVDGRNNVRVNSVHPNTVLTPLVEGIANEYPGGANLPIDGGYTAR